MKVPPTLSCQAKRKWTCFITIKCSYIFSMIFLLYYSFNIKYTHTYEHTYYRQHVRIPGLLSLFILLTPPDGVLGLLSPPSIFCHIPYVLVLLSYWFHFGSCTKPNHKKWLVFHVPMSIALQIFIIYCTWLTHISNYIHTLIYHSNPYSTLLIHLSYKKKY